MVSGYRGPVTLGFSLCGQGEVERAAASGAALDGDVAAVQFYDGAGDREAEATAVGAALRVANNRGLRSAVVLLENMLQVFGQDAGTLVAHEDAHLAVPGGRSHRYAAPGGAILVCVGQEIEQHLLYAPPVGHHGEHVPPGRAGRGQVEEQ